MPGGPIRRRPTFFLIKLNRCDRSLSAFVIRSRQRRLERLPTLNSQSAAKSIIVR
jgi:hypothetical protein